MRSLSNNGIIGQREGEWKSSDRETEISSDQEVLYRQIFEAVFFNERRCPSHTNLSPLGARANDATTSGRKPDNTRSPPEH